MPVKHRQVAVRRGTVRQVLSSRRRAGLIGTWHAAGPSACPGGRWRNVGSGCASGRGVAGAEGLLHPEHVLLESAFGRPRP